jgi:hypothetical protein
MVSFGYGNGYGYGNEEGTMGTFRGRPPTIALPFVQHRQ